MEELYEIVKNVPREAWPSMELIGGVFVDENSPLAIDDKVAEQAFVGSMMAWLAPYGVEVRSRTQPDGSTRYIVVPSGVWDDRIENPQLVAALAEAVRRVHQASEEQQKQQ